ncbi:methylglyoxal synthase [Rhodoferax antarcticus]|uniref:Methylglyoxal synthase n=1 Tax=Rhodoferax antarcticus ANT.BR TaxID=1111071 RepID=A0A1Q8YH25_9BURK|nr:methylglyoxal synthase [Rhodoferax antarcticus]OLP07368.1 methylglyoxal synthase [Rhodoferax antarcticus ANT.BR]
MHPTLNQLSAQKRIALIAHDNKKKDLLEWAAYNRPVLLQHTLCATGTTGSLLEKVLGTQIEKLRSGPLGGDQQIGAKIAEGVVDFIIFFWDPLEPQPHDPDVKALLRLAVVWNVPVACNRASADFMISSPLMCSPYERILPDFEQHMNRFAQNLIVLEPGTDAATELPLMEHVTAAESAA